MTLATIMDAEREYVRNVGYERQDQAWICSDRDAWYPNPWYVGAYVPHPESSEAYYADQNEADEAEYQHVKIDELSSDELPSMDNSLYDDIPF